MKKSVIKRKLITLNTHLLDCLCTKFRHHHKQFCCVAQKFILYICSCVFALDVIEYAVFGMAVHEVKTSNIAREVKVRFKSVISFIQLELLMIVVR